MVRAMEKKAMAAVIARRGCNIVWPRDRNPWEMRVRKGMTFVEANAGWADDGETRVGPRIVFGIRRRSVLPRTMGGLVALAAWPLVWARIRSMRVMGGSGRGDFSISIQAAPRWAS